jgi:hypothetical protein
LGSPDCKSITHETATTWTSGQPSGRQFLSEILSVREFTLSSRTGRPQLTRRRHSSVIPSRINRVGKLFETFHRNRFEQDVVTKTWSNRHIDRNIAISQRFSICERQG